MYIVCKMRSFKKFLFILQRVRHFSFFTTYLFSKYQYIYLNINSVSYTFFFEMHVKEFVKVCFSERVSSQFVNNWSVTCLSLVSMENKSQLLSNWEFKIFTSSFKTCRLLLKVPLKKKKNEL